MELVIATQNRGKFAELYSGLTVLGLSLRSLNDFPEIPEAPETGSSFSQIAREKAQYYFDGLKGRDGILAEDSGLVIPALDGYPGIISARIGRTDEERIRIILQKLRAHSDRSAYYQCNMVFVSANKWIETEGRCYGTIAETARGNLGFGYDPIFIPENFDLTFGEMNLTQKASLSHRGRALLKMIPQLQEHLKL